MHGTTTRRQFLGTVGVGGTLAIGSAESCAPRADANLHGDGARLGSPTLVGTGAIPRRTFGSTGVAVSALGLGGSHLGEAGSEANAIAIVHEAIDHGVTFFDNAWEYHQGRSEAWLGAALRGKRDQVFLMTKVCTHGRDAGEAMRQLDASLTRLGTDHLDLWQVHECVYDNDPERHSAPGGVLEALARAKQQGKVRFVGFTGHKDPRIHLAMLATGFAFDAAQMPLNCFDASFRSFEQTVVPECARRNVAVLGMKSLGGNGQAIQRGIVTAEEALRYAMSLPVVTTISGCDSIEVLRQNLAVARGLVAMTDAEKAALRARVAPYAADGRYELYKISALFDADEGRRQHGFPPQSELPL